MTIKSAGRRQRDAERRAALGITSGKKVFDREKTSRCWYQLKEVHQRSQKSIEKLALLFGQYRHKVVLMKVAKNGDQARFDELLASIPPLVAEMQKDFQELWDSHGDKRKLCLQYEELMQAFKIFEAYQAFDIDLFNKFQPIIGELNAIYNKALKQLLDSADEATLNALNDPAGAAKLAAEVEAPVEGLGEIGKEEGMDPVKKNFLEREPGAASRPTFETADVQSQAAAILDTAGVAPGSVDPEHLDERGEEAADPQDPEAFNIDPRMGHDLIRIN